MTSNKMASQESTAQLPQRRYHSFVDFAQDEIDGIGFIVPQQVYVHFRPDIPLEEQWRKNRPPPINFKINGRLGISILEALQLDYQPYKELRLAPVPKEYHHSAPLQVDRGYVIRIQWPGWTPYSSKRSEVPFNIQLASDLKFLIIRIARTIQQFLEKPTEHLEGQWNGWDNIEKFKKNLDKVYLLRLVSVSALTWQPVLAVEDKVFMPQS
ncbi:hypothetical protein BDY19DRAFT_587195 [Irpex rosettiformis]|uniref:Uncharacterized protein n=1 Tax=Irpex rosettiformis TaxID=378272 RepID=A0ACB8UDG4_9APHY|nr:hypothetical protein BDY19DRAFT_587195 [Irpex rosettiformis]